jgi:uncharacterized membrane protein YdbT with pleckstrin-like domain
MMKNSRSETTLAHVRTHWGIFTLPVLVFLALFLITIPAVIVIHVVNNTMSQLNPQAGKPIGGLFLSVLVLPEILLGLAMLSAVWMAYLKSTITLTDRRLMFRTGLFIRQTGELPLDNVDAIFLTEPWLGPFLGYGTVTVTSVGGLQFPLRYIGSPQDFHAILQQAVAAAKSSIPPAIKSVTPPQDDDSRYMPKG